MDLLKFTIFRYSSFGKIFCYDLFIMFTRIRSVVTIAMELCEGRDSL